MWKLILNIKFLLIIFFLFSDSVEGRELVRKDDGKKPIVITSQRMVAINKNNKLIFEKDVVAKKDDVILYADKMEILFTKVEDSELIDVAAKGSKPMGDRDISTITAIGNVKVIKGEKTITANEAVYYKDEDKIVLTGETKAWEKNDIVTGTKMIIFLKEEKSIVEGSKVIVHPQQGGQRRGF